MACFVPHTSSLLTRRGEKNFTFPLFSVGFSNICRQQQLLPHDDCSLLGPSPDRRRCARAIIIAKTTGQTRSKQSQSHEISPPDHHELDRNHNRSQSAISYCYCWRLREIAERQKEREMIIFVNFKTTRLERARALMRPTAGAIQI